MLKLVFLKKSLKKISGPIESQPYFKEGMVNLKVCG